MKNAFLVGLTLLFAAACQAESPVAAAHLLAPFPAPGSNPNPGNPDPNSRVASLYHLDAEKGELVLEGQAAGYVLDGFYHLAPWAAVAEWIGLNGKLVISSQGFACVGDPGFKSEFRCMNHQREVTDELRHLELGDERKALLKHAVDNLLGRLRRIPDASDTHYLIDSLVTTTDTSSSFVLESINCDDDTAHQIYSCVLKSSAFKK